MAAPHFFLLLFLLAFTTIAITTTTSSSPPPLPPPKFKQAPLFHNSPFCPPPLSPSAASSCSTSALAHIAMTLDAAYLRGSVAAIHSILHHSSCPQSLQFHFLATPSSLPSLSSTLSSTFPSLSFRLHPFDPSHVSSLISTSLRPALDQPLNYARSYLSSTILSTSNGGGGGGGGADGYYKNCPCPGRVVYLDSDLILVDDIIELYNTPFPDPDTVIAAPEHCNANLTNYFTPTFWSNPLLSLAFERGGRKRAPCYFNTGVMVMDLVRWRDGGCTEKIEEWMELQKRMRIYELGSLPPFLLEFAGRVGEVEQRWNQHGLGGDNRVGSCRDLHPGKASLLHWSGKGKPWNRVDEGRPCPLDAIWMEFDLIDDHDRRKSTSVDMI